MKLIFSKQPNEIHKKLAFSLMPLLLGLCLNSTAFAKSPKSKPAATSTETSNSRDLDLSIPDEWLEDDATSDPFDQAANHEQEQQLIISKHKKRPVNVDCGMDVNPYAQPDSSIGNRLTGECDFNYRY